MRIPSGDAKGRRTRSFVAAEAASGLADEAPLLLDRAAGVEWYERPGNDVDFAAYMLCRLRRARAGEKGGPQHGDEAVRAALARANRTRSSGSRAARSRTWTRPAFPKPSSPGSRRRRGLTFCMSRGLRPFGFAALCVSRFTPTRRCSRGCRSRLWECAHSPIAGVSTVLRRVSRKVPRRPAWLRRSSP